MATRYVLSREAQRDLELIRDYYLREAGTQVARDMLGQLRKAFRFLTSTPGAGHWRDDLTDEPVRFWSVLGYLIVYDPATQPLGIARVLHASRDLETLFRNTPPRA